MQNAYVLWILGGLFGFVSFLLGVIGKLGLIMFQWRREIDAAINLNTVAIARIETIRTEVERIAAQVNDLTTRLTQVRERRLIERRRKDDDMEDDSP